MTTLFANAGLTIMGLKDKHRTAFTLKWKVRSYN